MGRLTTSEIATQSGHGAGYSNESLSGSWWLNTEISNTLYTVLTTWSTSYSETAFLDTTVCAVYSSDGVGGGTVRKFVKRWWTIVSSNTTTGAQTGVYVPVILTAGSYFVYNSDATNFPGGTANATRVLWAVNTTDNTVELRLYGSTSPAATSVTNHVLRDSYCYVTA